MRQRPEGRWLGRAVDGLAVLGGAVLGLLIGAAGASFVRLGRRDDRLVTGDPVTRRRIEARLAALAAVPLVTRPEVTVPGRGAPLASEPVRAESHGGVRGRLWRDTSIALVVLGIVLVAGSFGSVAPTGAVLDATATPPARDGEVISGSPAPDAPQSAPLSSAVGTSPARTQAPALVVPAPVATAPTRRPSMAPPTSYPPAAAGSDRLALLEACPGRAACYRYTVRPGDNLFSIAHWFGVPLEAVRRLNPQVGTAGTVYPGEVLALPAPTR